MAEQADALSIQASEIALTLQEYIDQVEYNPKRLNEVETRLGLLATLKKKYGSDEEAVLAFAEQAREKLDNISHAEERIAEMEEMEEKLLLQLAEAASRLSESRSAAAETLSSAVEKELADLKMAGARFSASITRKPDEAGVDLGDGEKVRFTGSGVDHVEFLIAPNPGEGLKPMVKIASGGETSRLMLALKNVLANADTIPTLIFDEIDQGIGGRVGATVGEKLWQLGASHQVLCVTHLPQLAAFGNQHFHVMKQVVDGRTVTVVEVLSDTRRVDELAQMFGGKNDVNLAAAQETLNTATEFKAGD